MGRPKRVKQPPPTVGRAPCNINPETGAPDPPYDLRLRGAALERVQAEVERRKRDYPTYEELDEEGKRLADERMVRKFRGLDR